VTVPVVKYLLSPVKSDDAYKSWISLGGIDSFPVGETRLAKFTNPVGRSWDGETDGVACWVRRIADKEFQVFAINCAVCHGATGQGNGITSKYGLLGIANYHQDKYRQMADGQIFNTITHGYNTMMAYGDKVTVKDRWAIIAYIRVLQKSQNARIEDVPPDQRGALENEGKQQNMPQEKPSGPPPEPQTQPKQAR